MPKQLVCIGCGRLQTFGGEVKGSFLKDKALQLCLECWKRCEAEGFDWLNDNEPVERRYDSNKRLSVAREGGS